MWPVTALLAPALLGCVYRVSCLTVDVKSDGEDFRQPLPQFYSDLWIHRLD